MGGQKKNTSSSWAWLGWLGLILLCLVGYAAYKVLGSNTGSFTEGEPLYIHTNASYTDVKSTLSSKGFISDMFSFDLLAKQVGYPQHIHAGKYDIQKGMSNLIIIRMLRSGRQTPVKLVINKLRTKQEFIRFVSTNLEADSTELSKMLSSPKYLAEFGLDTHTVMCGVMPDTYEFYWNTNADKTFHKIEKNYVRFWTIERKQLAQKQGITPQQAVIVASILEEETNKNDEKPSIASVYLNRLRKGVKLQADPTVKFAVGDFAIKRINGNHLNINSPYNTYMYLGLPPGPICTPSIPSIDAVLNAPATNYLFFCAKEDFSGYHRFASTYTQHQKNAHLYQQALNKHGIH
jgi:UPF0755 protein